MSESAAKIKLGLQKKLLLGNLKAERDWGYAGDYVRAMHLMLQQEKAEDFVIATGETHSVEEFAKLAFARLDLDYKEFVKVDENLIRPAEVDQLVGDNSKAKRILNWQPSVTFKQLVEMMVDSDLSYMRNSI
ncbi:MAG: hypothetical protein COX48_04720 [bacterium (Candidatus Stahlbacteria) CG23_combo_of_CG06-09_8_20_14_all_34_7]|nr:MAG: hypothetical protein COX48_04720 [bacterium (Candidatus Stahlbacteria) CG23_combo_of_CG06-09_8_20_14_all_34_7]